MTLTHTRDRWDPTNSAQIALPRILIAGDRQRRALTDLRSALRLQTPRAITESWPYSRPMNAPTGPGMFGVDNVQLVPVTGPSVRLGDRASVPEPESTRERRGTHVGGIATDQKLLDRRSDHRQSHRLEHGGGGMPAPPASRIQRIGQLTSPGSR